MNTTPARAQIPRTPLFIAGDNSVAGAIATLLALDEPCGSCIASLTPGIATLHPNSPALASLVVPLGILGEDARVIPPPSRARMIFPRPGELIFYDLTNRGSRLGKVAYARTLFDSEMLFAHADLDRLTGADPDIAIGLWRHYVWNWARIGRHLGEEGAGLIAEIALGITARRYYLTGSIGPLVVAASTYDPIVAELTGRAILQLKAPARSDTTRAPWEAPLIQRASELKLGVQTPDQIALSPVWSGSPIHQARFESFIERFADLLSVTI
jgi:hypothetical protein